MVILATPIRQHCRTATTTTTAAAATCQVLQLLLLLRQVALVQRRLRRGALLLLLALLTLQLLLAVLLLMHRHCCSLLRATATTAITTEYLRRRGGVSTRNDHTISTHRPGIAQPISFALRVVVGPRDVLLAVWSRRNAIRQRDPADDLTSSCRRRATAAATAAATAGTTSASARAVQEPHCCHVRSPRRDLRRPFRLRRDEHTKLIAADHQLRLCLLQISPGRWTEIVRCDESPSELCRLLLTALLIAGAVAREGFDVRHRSAAPGAAVIERAASTPTHRRTIIFAGPTMVQVDSLTVVDLHKTPLFAAFPYVCPEPVLAK